MTTLGKQDPSKPHMSIPLTAWCLAAVRRRFEKARRKLKGGERPTAIECEELQDKLVSLLKGGPEGEAQHLYTGVSARGPVQGTTGD